MNYRLHCCDLPIVLEGFSDVNRISNSHDVKSTSGYVFALGGGAIS